MLLGSTITKTLHFPLLFQTDSVTTDKLVGALDGLFCIFLNLHIKLEIVGFFFLYLVSVVGSFISFIFGCAGSSFLFGLFSSVESEG